MNMIRTEPNTGRARLARAVPHLLLSNLFDFLKFFTSKQVMDVNHPFLHFPRRREAYCRSRLPLLEARLQVPHYCVDHETLIAVRQEERYNRLVTGPWRRLFNNHVVGVQECTLEFLSSFSFNNHVRDIFEKSIKYRAGGIWHECSVAEFGQDLGVYGNDEDWAGAMWTFPDEEYKSDRDFGNMRNTFWRTIGTGNYNPSVSKSSNLKDPLHRYVHRLLSHTITQRGNATGVVNLKDLLCLYCMVHNEPCNLGYLFAQLFDSNSRATDATPIFGGAWITQLYDNLGIDPVGTPGLANGRVDLPLCRSMHMIADVQNEGPRFKDKKGQIWDPEDPTQVIMHIDQPQHHQPQYHQSGPSHQHESGPSAPRDFPSMLDLQNEIRAAGSYARQAYEQAQLTHTELTAWSGRVEHIETEVTYMRGRMDRYWGPDDTAPGR